MTVVTDEDALAAEIEAARAQYDDDRLGPVVERMRADAIRLGSLNRCSGPLDLACELNPATVRTPALELLSHEIEGAITEPNARIILSIPPQEGKLVSMDTTIPTLAGQTTFADVRPGDMVFHPSGKPVAVTAVHPPGMADLRVHFSDHGHMDVHGGHEWTVWDRSRRAWRTVETRYLVTQRLHSGPEGARGGRYRFQLPWREAADTPEADLPIDPYTLGLWLGNGRASDNSISRDPRKVYEYAYAVTSTYVQRDTGVVYDRLGNGFRALLGQHHLINNKHVPRAYLRGSIRQRRDLLAGLIDTDGHIPARGQQVSFDNTDEQMVRDVAELLRSLGYRAHVHRPTPADSGGEVNGRTVEGRHDMWRVTYSPHDGEIPTRLDLHRRITATAQRERTAITRIEPIEPRPGRCITVDSPDGLFLAGEHWTPTHNSTIVQRGVVRALQHNSDTRVAMASYAADLARRNGSAVYDLIKQSGTGAVEPDTGLPMPDLLGIGVPRSGRAAQSNWRLARAQGGVYSVGVGGGLTGRPVDLAVIDDPVKDRREADSQVMRDRAHGWYTSVLRTRLAPGASIILVLCMTGDTPVLMADGVERPLRDVRPGDQVATYEHGTVTTATVRNWANQGPDTVYRVRMMSGVKVRGNARHPFLVRDEEGRETWRRLRDLKVGDAIVRVMRPGEPSPDGHARPTGVIVPRGARACACPATPEPAGPPDIAPRRLVTPLDAPSGSSSATASPSRSTTDDWPSRMGAARSAVRPPRTLPDPGIGPRSSASTTTTTPAPFGGCCATTATSSSREATRPISSTRPPSTFAITSDRVAEIVLDGTEDVFDIQVDRTENFIANGLAAHNTRWHEDDLAGRLLADNTEGWREVSIAAQALAPDPTAQPPINPDPLGRPPGMWLVSARGRSVLDWLATMRALGGGRDWSALYQQRPAPPEGGLFKRSWFDRWRITDGCPEIRRAIVVIDPSDNTGEGDEAGIIVGGTTPEGQAVLLDDCSGEMTVAQWFRTAIMAAVRWQAASIAYERSLSNLRKRLRDEWRQIRRECRALREAGAVEGYIAEGALAAVVEHMSEPEDEAEEVDALRARLLALVPYLDRILDHLPESGIPTRQVVARGSKEYRAELITGEYERGRVRIVGHLYGLEHQALTWQPGQSSPDRLDAMTHLTNLLIESSPAQVRGAAGTTMPTRPTGPSGIIRSTNATR